MTKSGMDQFYQDADSLFVRVYDAFYVAGAPIGGDIAFYERLARETGGGVLELACGTGRIALALAETGLEITGVDISEGMLSVARHKVVARALKQHLTLIHQEMSQLNLGRRFGFVFVPARSFQHLLTIDLQRVGRSRALEIVLSGDDFGADIAERYGWVNRTLDDDDLDSFVDTLVGRLASFDRETLAAAKAQLNRFGTPTATELQSSTDMFFSTLALPGAQARRAKIGSLGYGLPSDFELNFGSHLPRLGRADDDDMPTRPG
jgi:SAM-dependent methyltransferase